MFAETIFCNLPYFLLYQKITLIFVKVPKRVGREFFGTDKLFWSILYAFDASIYSAKCKFAKVQLILIFVIKTKAGMEHSAMTDAYVAIRHYTAPLITIHSGFGSNPKIEH